MKPVATIAKWLAVIVYAACAVVIVASVVPVGGWKALDVLTGSMRPQIQPGDLVIIRRVPLRDIHPGDIVTYTNPTNPQQTITHRVVSLPVKDGLQMVVTKGDANAAQDPAFAGGHIVGKVELHLPMVGKLAGTLHSPLGLLALIIVPGLLVIFGEIQSLRRTLAQPKKEPVKAKNDPPNQTPPASPPSPQRPARSARRLDGMGPRSMALLLLLGLLPVGYTYARPTTNAVTALGKVVVLAAPTSADQCKNGGWQNFQNPDGSPRFKNQGDCVSFVNSNKHVSITNTTNITITNESAQSGQSGNVSGGTSGNVSNTNSTNTTVTVH